MGLDIVIMAAGKGTRMKSARPKVLHTLAGRSLLQHVLETAARLGAKATIVVTGHGAEAVEAAVAPRPPGLAFMRQMPQLGTGHAVQQAAPALADDGVTLILNGDVPLVDAATLRALVDAVTADGQRRLAILTVVPADPTGYGRIVRRAEPGAPASAGRIEAIVEHKDATPAQLAIGEVYTGVMAAPGADLKRWLADLTNANSQGEYYLTEVVALAVAEGVEVASVAARRETDVQGVNSPAQLADLERSFQRDQADALMEAGVRLADPARIDVRGRLVCGRDVEIDVGCVFEGSVALGDEVRIGAHCVIRNAAIGSRTQVHPFTHVDGGEVPGGSAEAVAAAPGVTVGADALIGPFARLRPGADLADEVHIGNFVEVKNSTLAKGAKANHLAYLGDASVGERVNFGAGSITANYDGAAKHRTRIGADVHVGSNCVLIAPVTLGEGATIGGGSTIAEDAPAGQLTLARARQVTIARWKRPVKTPR